jgi:hypothetical protein
MARLPGSQQRFRLQSPPVCIPCARVGCIGVAKDYDRRRDVVVEAEGADGRQGARDEVFGRFNFVHAPAE